MSIVLFFREGLFWIYFFVLSLSSLFSASSKIKITAFYPAPFGDFESLRTNSLECIGVSRSSLISGDRDIEKGVTTIPDLNFISFYRGLRVLGEFVEPYSDVDRDETPLALYCDYEWDKVFFKDSGKGVFFENPQNGLFFHKSLASSSGTGVDTEFVGLRSKKNIVLHSGAPNDSTFDTYDIVSGESQAIICRGKLLLKGPFQILASDGTQKFDVDSSGNVTIAGDLSVAGSLTFSGRLIINGDLEVKGTLKAHKAVFDNVRVRNALVVQSDKELDSERSVFKDVPSVRALWDRVKDKKDLNDKSESVFVNARFTKLLIMESAYERKRVKKASAGNKWSWVDLDKSKRSVFQVAGDLISKSIMSPFSNRFEIRVNNNKTIARFHRGRRGARNPVLEVPGIVVGYANSGKHFI